MATLPDRQARIRPGHAELRVGAEHLRIEEQVVDAAVDHVDRLGAVDRAHPHPVARIDEEVCSLDQRHPHLLGEEARARSRRCCSTPGVSTTTCGWRRPRRSSDASESSSRRRLIRVVVDRQDRLTLEEVGEGALGDRPVLQQVADSRRHPEVVLQHVHDAVGVANEIAAADVRPHAELRRHADALGTHVDRAFEQLGGEDAVGHALDVRGTRRR